MKGLMRGYARPTFQRSLIFGCLALSLSGCPRSSRMMSWPEYTRHSYQWPYILNIYTDRGALLYFGAKHSNDPRDAQFAEIEALWKQFQPQLAFNEGGDPPVAPTRDVAIMRFGEPGLIRFLAARDKIPVRSIDPTRAEEVAILEKKFPPEKIKMFFILRQLSEYGRIIQPPESREDHLRNVIDILGLVPGLDVPPKSVSELEPTFARNFPSLGDYRDANPGWFDPTLNQTAFNQIARYSSEYRDRYMVDLICRRVCGGNRVFAVVGASHVVMEEPAVRSRLRQKCAP